MTVPRLVSPCNVSSLALLGGYVLVMWRGAPQEFHTHNLVVTAVLSLACLYMLTLRHIASINGRKLSYGFHFIELLGLKLAAIPVVVFLIFHLIIQTPHLEMLLLLVASIYILGYAGIVYALPFWVYMACKLFYITVALQRVTNPVYLSRIRWCGIVVIATASVLFWAVLAGVGREEAPWDDVVGSAPSFSW